MGQKIIMLNEVNQHWKRKTMLYLYKREKRPERRRIIKEERGDSGRSMRQKREGR